MKKLILKMFFIWSIIISCCAVSQAAQTDENVTLQWYLNRLTALGVYTGGEDLKAEVTRAEVAEMVAGVTAMEDANAEITFSDVPRSHPYYGQISRAYLTGIIRGYEDGTFRPDAPISRNELMKILVCMTGYDGEAAAQGGWPHGYLKTAFQLGLVKGNGIDGNVTREEFIKSVYHAVNTPVKYAGNIYIKDLQLYQTDSENTLMKYIMGRKGLSFDRGIVTSDGITSINAPAGKDEGAIYIDDKRFINKNAMDVYSILGMYVEYWYNLDGELTAVYPFKDQNQVYTYQAEDIAECSGDLTSYKVYEGDTVRYRRLNLNQLRVVYNGQGINGYQKADMVPNNGTIKLIDHDDDGYIDVVFVNDSMSYVVNTVGRSGYSVTYKTYPGQEETGYSVEENDLETSYIVLDQDSNKVSPGDITPDSVVSVMKSRDGKVLTVYVTKETAEGMLSSIHQAKGTVTIADTVYQLSRMKSGAYYQPQAEAGSTVRAYLNENHKVVYLEKEAQGGTVYAYVIDVWQDPESAEDNWYIKIATAGYLGTIKGRNYSWVNDKLVQNKAVETYQLTEKTRIDGMKLTQDAVLSCKQQIVELNAGEDGIIRKMTMLAPDFEYTKGEFNHNTQAMTQKDLVTDFENPAILLTGGVKGLAVPKDPGASHSDEEYLSKYRIENENRSHQVAVYGMEEGVQTPKLIVMKVTMTEESPEVSFKGVVRTKASQGINADGTDVYVIELFSQTGAETVLEIREDAAFAASSVKKAVTEIEAGDLVELRQDTYGNVIKINVLASASNISSGIQTGPIYKVQTGVIWNKGESGSFYHLFYYRNQEGARDEIGVKTENALFQYYPGRKTVEKIDVSGIAADETLEYSDRIVAAGGMAVIIRNE